VLGYALNMTIVAEGVETFEELAYLKLPPVSARARVFIFGAILP